ncbi:MAG TPA: HlyD family secretion protein [Stellaceae bacterium]|nr:HlyD family secretion protein [Stellaceae bacterium]
MSAGVVIEREASAPAPKSRPRLRPKRLGLSALAFALALGGAWYGYDWWTEGRFVESTDDAYAGGNVTPISPHVSGFVAQILVADNQYVHAGDLIIRLDDRDVQAALDRATAIVGEREATLTSLQAKYLLQQSTIRQAAADVSAKTAQAAFARQDDVRYRQLLHATVGSEQNAQKALAVDQAAQAAVLASEAGLDAAKQQLDVLNTEIAEARAAVAQAQADLQTARLNLGYTQIRAPIDGYIGNRAAQVGAYVSEGAYLVTIIPAQGLWVDANFKEDQLARMVPGEAATVVADVLPGHAFQGHVLSLAPATGAVFSVIPPENATGNFTKIVQRVPVRIALDPGDPRLGLIRPGLSTTVSVDTRSDAGRAK